MEEENVMGSIRRLPNGARWEKPVWEAVRKRAIESMDPVCALCGKPIDMSLPAQTPMSCEVDHIIPISRGGAPYDIDNLQLTHRRCNRLKSNKLSKDFEDAKENLCPLSNNW